ncbi:deoxyribose-phosphate aldolase [Prevotella disiens]|uniref:Deoxyribose-phosphate aldolase n=1 Tax=Prevotella disiens DNF00882 TaxID=1401075 RepID=A0A096ASX6_9BACT|nr:deoxyribose-phosphate aldolase [Prevotella disiens]KGF49806.1 deoxyribose-phosphate aldolase [Prevotella disiens DNF00882]
MEKNEGKIQSTSKYNNMLKEYDLNITDEQVKEAVKKIIAEKVPENDTLEVKEFLLGSVELTTLRTVDTEEDVLAMVEKVNKFAQEYPTLPHVAAVCAYPCFTKLIAESLEVDGVDITNVTGNFPSSQTFLEVKTIETKLAIQDGATQIDIVLPVGKFLSGDYEDVYDTVSELKQTCGEIPMKVILETGDLPNARSIKEAALLSMFAGAEYVKTSTGKEKVSATPEAVYIMCTAIKEFYDKTGIQVGLKPAGGINTVMDAVIFYTIYKEILGEKWLDNYWFRLGTSRLTNLLLSEIEGKEIKFF